MKQPTFLETVKEIVETRLVACLYHVMRFIPARIRNEEMFRQVSAMYRFNCKIMWVTKELMSKPFGHVVQVEINKRPLDCWREPDGQVRMAWSEIEPNSNHEGNA